MWNDADIEMAQATAAANQAAAQATGRIATRFDVNFAIRDAVSYLHFSGGESPHTAMLTAIEDRPDVAWTSELRDEIQLTAWERYNAEWNAENADQG